MTLKEWLELDEVILNAFRAALRANLCKAADKAAEELVLPEPDVITCPGKGDEAPQA